LVSANSFIPDLGLNYFILKANLDKHEAKFGHFLSI
jgi:hypothetical protein